MVYGCQNDNRLKRVARGMQGGLINIWRFSRVCNVFQEGREEGSIVELVGLVYLVGPVTRADPGIKCRGKEEGAGLAVGETAKKTGLINSKIM